MCKAPYWFTLRGLKSNSPVLHGPMELVDVAYYADACEPFLYYPQQLLDEEDLEKAIDCWFGSSYEADIDAVPQATREFEENARIVSGDPTWSL